MRNDFYVKSDCITSEVPREQLVVVFFSVKSGNKKGAVHLGELLFLLSSSSGG